MQFGVLGPLSVSDGVREIGPERGRQRTLLAVLLVHANETVSLDRLVDALWSTPPASASHAVEVHVSELRRRLADERGPRILTRPGGYLLRVERDELDAERFERACREAREAVARGESVAAVDAFLSAEAMWRGHALGELADEPFARAEAARLDGRRVAARGERLEAQLAAGRHHEIIGELEALTLQEPWNEGVHAQLMLALYRDGRQADALALYQRLRTTLADELGIEPGPAVEGLQLAILRHEPAISAPLVDGPERDERRWTTRPAATPGAIVQEHQLETKIARRLVTALLVDPVEPAVTGASTWARDPEHARRAQLRLIEDVEAVGLPAGGAVVAMADGGVMSIFGAEVAREDHAALALGAALTLLRRLTAARRGPDVPLPAIVVDSGEVLVEPGIPGAGGIIGGPVGDLLPLRDTAVGGEIRVGARAASAARSAFVFDEPILLEARARPVVGRRLLGPAGEQADVGSRMKRLIGRDRESGELDRAWSRVVEERSPRLTLVMGDPGIGKSALVRSWTGAAEADGVAVTRGRCLAYGQGITYWPLAEILRDRLRLDVQLDERQVLERLGDRRILGLTLGLDPSPGLHPVAAQRQLHAAWVELLESEVAAGPMVVVIEDLHWAETPLIELVGTVARTVRGPLFVVATARPEFTAHAGAIESGRHVSAIWLEPLSDADARTLAAERLGSARSADVDEVLRRAEGNPFFIEELFASLIDRGALTSDGERGEPGPTARNTLPDSVRSVLESRLELLDADSRDTLQVASVVGRRFDVAAVEALLGAAPPRLDELVRRELVRPLPDAPGDTRMRYLFKHALTRDAAYETLTLARRARLHGALAEHLERQGSGTADHAAVVAYHYLEAASADGAQLAWEGDPDALVELETKARRWAMEAARRAKARYAIDEAVALLDRALACHPDRVEASAMWLEIGRANVLRYDGVGFWSAMDAAIQLAGSDSERAAIYAELAFETAFRWAIWARMPERQLVDGWIDRALELSSADSRALAYTLIARAYWHPLEARDASDRAIAIAERLDDPVLLSYALDAQALTVFAAGDDKAAFARWERRTALATQISDLDHLEDLYGAAIAGNVALGRFAEARRFADLHDDVATQLSNHHRVHAIAMHLELEELAGGWARMLSLSERAEQAVAANLATPCVRNQRSLLACALAAARLGRDEASRRLEAAAEALGMQGYEAVFDPMRVRIAVARGEAGAIRDRLPLGMPPPSKNWWRLTTMVARLEAALALGDHETVEREAAPLLVDGTLLGVFATRALAAARADPALAAVAAEGFARLGIEARDALLA